MLKSLFFRFTGYSYTNLGRLFMRLFVGVMLIQFGVRQLMHFYDLCDTFPTVLGMSSTATLTIMICVEMICSLFIMCGFLTRFMTIPPLLTMIFAELHLLGQYPIIEYSQLTWSQPVYLPIMFIGIFIFMLLTGPGKISVDYFLSLHMIHTENLEEETELEEV